MCQLRGLLAPFVLRRLKKDVLDQLSEKTTVIVTVPMTVPQQKVYDDVLLGYAARKVVNVSDRDEAGILDVHLFLF
jgi:SNF2 family DNA or RNA helicase